MISATNHLFDLSKLQQLFCLLSEIFVLYYKIINDLKPYFYSVVKNFLPDHTVFVQICNGIDHCAHPQTFQLRIICQIVLFHVVSNIGVWFPTPKWNFVPTEVNIRIGKNRCNFSKFFFRFDIFYIFSEKKTYKNQTSEYNMIIRS